MTIRQTLTLSNTLVVLAIAMTGLMFVKLDDSIRELIAVNELRSTTLLLGEELRNSSEELTTMVRQFAVTGNPDAEKAYNDILAERSGQIPRKMTRKIEPGKRYALVELMKTYGVTAEELSRVSEANRLSNQLVLLEVESMNAVKGIFKDSNGQYSIRKTPDKEYAANIVYGAAYMAETERIMQPLDAFSIMIDERTMAKKEAVSSFVQFDQYIVTTCLSIVFLTSLFSAFYTHRRMTSPLEETTTFAERVASGDLTSTIAVQKNDEMGSLRRVLNSMVANLKSRIADSEAKSEQALAREKEARAAQNQLEHTLARASEVASHIKSVSVKLGEVVTVVSSASEKLDSHISRSAKGAEEQAARLGKTAATMEDMNATVSAVAANAEQATHVSDGARKKAISGAELVNQVLRSMEAVQTQTRALKQDILELGKQAEDIGQIMSVISDIADQTNLLALNAAIEAARAGDAGRGFAVVADEVRKLAEKTMGATGKVGQAVQDIQNGARQNIVNMEKSEDVIAQTSTLASQSGAALEEIVSLVDDSTKEVLAITHASHEQSRASDAITEALDQISTISQETRTAMREASHAVSQLADQVHEMTMLTSELDKNS